MRTWFLVFMFDKFHANPEKNDRAVKKWDIIDTHPDSEVRELPSPDAPFYLIGCEGMSWEESRIYTTTYSVAFKDDIRAAHLGYPFRIRPVAKKLFKIDVDSLPDRHKRNLSATKMTNFDEGREEFEKYIINKRTGKPERSEKSPLIALPVGVSLPRYWRTALRN